MSENYPSTCSRCGLTYVGFRCCPSCVPEELPRRLAEAPDDALEHVVAEDGTLRCSKHFCGLHGVQARPTTAPPRSWRAYQDTRTAWEQYDDAAPMP